MDHYHLIEDYLVMATHMNYNRKYLKNLSRTRTTNMAQNEALLFLMKITKVRTHDSFLLYVAKYGLFRRHGLSHMIAGIQGFEPQLKASKASVLPLDDIPIGNARLPARPLPYHIFLAHSSIFSGQIVRLSQLRGVRSARY